MIYFCYSKRISDNVDFRSPGEVKQLIHTMRIKMSTFIYIEMPSHC